MRRSRGAMRRLLDGKLFEARIVSAGNLDVVYSLFVSHHPPDFFPGRITRNSIRHFGESFANLSLLFLDILRKLEENKRKYHGDARSRTCSNSPFSTNYFSSPFRSNEIIIAVNGYLRVYPRGGRSIDKVKKRESWFSIEGKRYSFLLDRVQSRIGWNGKDGRTVPGSWRERKPGLAWRVGGERVI